MFSKVNTGQRDQFLDQAKAARQERAQDKNRDKSAIKIQSLVRGFLSRRRFGRNIREEVDAFLQMPSDEDEYKPKKLKPAIDLYNQVRVFLVVFDPIKDRKRFEFLCKYLLLGMNTDNIKTMYVSMITNKKFVLLWIQQIKDVLLICSRYFQTLKPELISDMRMIVTCLSVCVTFTSCTNWKILGKLGDSLKPGMIQLCNNLVGHLHSQGLYKSLQVLLTNGLARTKPCFTKAALTAIVTMSTRPLIAGDFSDKILTLFVLHILAVPALIRQLCTTAEDCIIKLMEYRLFRRSLELLTNEQNTKIIFNTLEGSYALCLLANLVELGCREMEGLVENTDAFLTVVTQLLEHCHNYVESKRSHMTHWHPILGWFSQKYDPKLNDALPHVTKQLQLLWSVKMLPLLFDQLFAYSDQLPSPSKPDTTSSGKNPFKKALEKASNKNKARLKLDSPIFVSTCHACTMYRTAIATLTQLKMDIVVGLCYKDILLPRLWRIIMDLGPGCGIKGLLEILATDPEHLNHPVFSLLQLGCDTALHIITILDDIEMYEQNKPFQLEDLVSVSRFLNSLYFKIIWNGFVDMESIKQNSVMTSVHSFLMLLYERDCRRNYTPPDHWLISEVRPKDFLSEIERGKAAAKLLLQKVPHIIPHRERVILFRRKIQQEKEALGLTESSHASPQSTLITVFRRRVVEDGYRQLSLLPPNALKGCIRVKFVNEQGLDEAGIDQDGVFKEFLEETIKQVFDPSLNLFKVTEEQKLYPSPTSYIQENHLALFDFVGRMLGKAVYEGIVVDVPFAPFFLSQILGHTHSATYSSIDELPSLDKDLYKNLTYLKHYDGDVSDLDLTFSYDEDILGKLTNYELVPGGRVIPVTNDNRISYIHLMAHHKMRTQIREQSAAFLHGFKAIIRSEWLEMFSGPEIQKLISGDNSDIDLQDLRKHTQYYGGFHNGHKVINWLWEILQKDFNPDERALFLKFVTSCSKPPLLGFGHLEPPFSIRCVEVSEDQDTGDTLGSVLKGFLNIRKKDPIGRLPTSSTCFNLLKLPNYQKKSTLRDKLRYAITSNTGFELS